MIDQFDSEACINQRSPNADQSKWNQLAQAMFIGYEMTRGIDQQHSPRHTASLLDYSGKLYCEFYHYKKVCQEDT